MNLKKLTRKIWILLYALISFNLMATSMNLQTEHDNKKEIKLLSWNTMLLPFPISISHQTTRTKEIIKAISKLDVDVVVLQEVFIPSKRRQILNKLKKQYPYQTYLEKNSFILSILSSGVVILSKFPLTNIKKMYFKNVNLLSTDRFASKGAILATVNVDDKLKFQLIGTHMQSGDDKKNASVRKKQLQEIYSFAKKNMSANLNQFLMGDLNIDKYNETEYSEVQSNFHPKNFPLVGPLKYSFGNHDISCILPLHSLYSDSAHLYDHFWEINNTQEMHKNFDIFAKNEILSLKGNVSGKICDLSDHLPINVRFIMK